jgi:hypothetical protein
MHPKGRCHILRSLSFSHALYGKYAHFFKGVVRKASSISLHARWSPAHHKGSVFVAYISDS